MRYEQIKMKYIGDTTQTLEKGRVYLVTARIEGNLIYIEFDGLSQHFNALSNFHSYWRIVKIIE